MQGFLFNCGHYISVGELLSSNGMILSFVSESVFLLLPPSNLLSSLSVEGCKRITEGRKETRIHSNTKHYFGVYDYSVTGTFSWTSRSCYVSQKYIGVLFGAKRLNFVVYPVGVFSEVGFFFLAEAAANRIHNLPLSLGLKAHVCYPTCSREKAIPFSTSVER